MKAIILLVIFCVYAVQAWIAVEHHNPEQDNKSHCFGNSYNVGALELNESKRVEGVCAQAFCKENRDVIIRGCAPVMANPPCYVTEGILSKPYPECCYEIKCVEEKTIYLEDVNNSTRNNL